MAKPPPTQNGLDKQLIQAATKNNPARINALIAAGASIEAKDTAGWAPLFLAAWSGSADSARALIAAGAKIDSRDDDGWTPLHLASSLGHADCAGALIAAGSDVEAKDNHGFTARQLAGQKGRDDVIAVFTAHSRMQALLKEAKPETPSVASSPASRRQGL